MDAMLPPEPSGGLSVALGALRHALADPLSAAGLKLELVERRLSGLPSSGELVERIRTAKGDLAVAGRLVDLLPRLGRVSGEAPAEVALGDLCREAGLAFEDGGTPGPRVYLRRRAIVDALRAVASLFRSPGPVAAPPRSRLESTPDRVFLRVEAPPGTRLDAPERLFGLPRGDERSEDLFLARAAVEADDGLLVLEEREGLLRALFSWPRPAPPGDAGTPA
jgi:hypothetical protein